MQRATGIIMVATMVAATLAGCALRNPRDDYSYSRADGLRDTGSELIDWNFPTSRNQGPIEVPRRLHPERTAIGGTGAPRNPLPLSATLPAQDASPAPAAQTADGTPGTDAPAAAPDSQDLRATAARSSDDNH